MKQKLLIISHDIISDNMAGSGIRYWELANVLKSVADVSLAVPAQSTLSTVLDISLIHYKLEEPETLRAAAGQADMLFLAGFTLHKFPFLVEMDRPIIIDLYGPFILENLELHAAKELSSQVALHKSDVNVLNSLLQRGDFFVCATEKQRDFWLGMLAANNRLNPYNYEPDKVFEKLIAVVPFGVTGDKPIHTKTVMKGAYKTIKKDDQVILWGGGVWDWLDPLTLIQALAEVVKVNPRAKLFFMGTQHPHQADVPKMRMVQAAQELAQNLGLLDTHIFFNEWVAYDDRQNYLLEADVGVSLHFQTIETCFSFRTRILDHIWTGLPTLANEGDAMAELIKKEGLGLVVPIGDVTATKEALLELLDLQPSARQVYHNNFERLSAKMSWKQISAPLVDFCRKPKRAPDKAVADAFKPSSWGQRLKRAKQTLRQQGPLGIIKLSSSYLKWRLLS